MYVSPQQAKALLNVLTQNVSQYEATFGEIKLEPHAGKPGAISNSGVALPLAAVLSPLICFPRRIFRT